MKRIILVLIAVGCLAGRVSFATKEDSWGSRVNTGKLKDPGLFGIRLPVVSQRGSSINPQ